MEWEIKSLGVWELFDPPHSKKGDRKKTNPYFPHGETEPQTKGLALRLRKPMV